MRLSAAVMAHPKRSEMVSDLLERLDRDVPVVWDEVNDRHDTGARAMEAFDPTCTHHLVIQDDALPCRDLLAGAERALEHVPDGCPASLYTGRAKPFGHEINRALHRKRTDACWVTMRGIYWGPAVILPTALIPEMLEWYRGEGSRVVNYDRRMSTWFALSGVSTWYTRPSLVEHRGDESLSHHGTKGRHALQFIGSDRSALGIDWSGPVVDFPHSDRFDQVREARRKKWLDDHPVQA